MIIEVWVKKFEFFFCEDGRLEVFKALCTIVCTYSILARHINPNSAEACAQGSTQPLFSLAHIEVCAQHCYSSSIPLHKHPQAPPLCTIYAQPFAHTINS